jgi:serine/threonine protein kinase
MLVAQAELAAARKALQENRLAMRSRVVRLVSLTSRHFPELKEHPDVLAFMGSDGLDASDRRRIADYDDVRPLATGRNELLRAKYGGADVCLKAFPLQGDMGAYKREFLRVQQLRHPYIVRYTAAFEDSGTMYLEMEYYKHGSLRNWLETTEPDALQKRAVLRQVLLALACVHSQGIVHSDIKGEVRVYPTLSPVSSVCVFSTFLFSQQQVINAFGAVLCCQNVLIADDGSPRICDFEMSKDLDTVSVSIAAGGGGFTPGFMCPRVLRGEAKLSPAADMYAFGVLVLNTITPPQHLARCIRSRTSPS